MSEEEDKVNNILAWKDRFFLGGGGGGEKSFRKTLMIETPTPTRPIKQESKNWSRGTLSVEVAHDALPMQWRRGRRTEEGKEEKGSSKNSFSHLVCTHLTAGGGKKRR